MERHPSDNSAGVYATAILMMLVFIMGILVTATAFVIGYIRIVELLWEKMT